MCVWGCECIKSASSFDEQIAASETTNGVPRRRRGRTSRPRVISAFCRRAKNKREADGGVDRSPLFFLFLLASLLCVFYLHVPLARANEMKLSLASARADERSAITENCSPFFSFFCFFLSQSYLHFRFSRGRHRTRVFMNRGGRKENGFVCSLMNSRVKLPREKVPPATVSPVSLAFGSKYLDN